MSKPDQPNTPRHAHLMAQWREGQIFETRIDECAHDDAAWVFVADRGRAQPVWDERQEYRRREDLERLAAAAADPGTIGREGLQRALAKVVAEGAATLTDEQIEKAALAAGLDEELWFGRFTPKGHVDTLPKLRRFAEAVRTFGVEGKTE